MIERNVYVAYAPRGPAVMCALLYIEVKLGVHVRYVGSRGYEYPVQFFVREDGVLPKNSNVGCRLVAWVPCLHCLHF